MEKRYLVETYEKAGEKPKIEVVYLNEIWVILNNILTYEKNHLPKMAISEVGRCVLDWS